MTKILKTAQRKIRLHYGLNREITMTETEAEIKNLIRKNLKGNLDNMDEKLMSALSVGKYSINFN